MGGISGSYIRNGDTSGDIVGDWFDSKDWAQCGFSAFWAAHVGQAGVLSVEGNDDENHAEANAFPYTLGDETGDWPNVGATASNGAYRITNGPRWVRARYTSTSGGAADALNMFASGRRVLNSPSQDAAIAAAQDAANAATAAAAANSAKFFVGFQRDVNCVHSGPVNLAATTGTASIPGPAAGKLRVFFQILLTSLGSTPSITTTLNPAGLVFGRAQSPGAGTAVTVSLAGVVTPIVLGVGETLDMANTGAADCTLYYSYYDIPDTNRTLVRTHFSSAPVTLIPAAAAGFYSKWLSTGCGSGGSGEVIRTATFGVNDDTAAAILQLLLGGVVVQRSSSQAAQAMFAALQFLFGPDLVITTDALAVETVSAVTTRDLNFMGCYETFAGTP